MKNLEKNFDLNELTSFKIGGKARYFVEVISLDQMEVIFKEIKKSNLPFQVLGGGTNVIISTPGYKGWIIKMSNNAIDQTGDMFDVEAGINLGHFIKYAYDSGFGGIHKLIGIPGTLGGAIRGNAGAYGVTVSDFVSEVLYFDTKLLKYYSIKKEKCKFGYRESVFKKKKNWIIVSARFYLKKYEKEKLKLRINKIIEERKKKPYYDFPTAGSIFKNVNIKKLIASSNNERREELKELLNDFYIQSGLSEKGIDKKSIEFIPAGYLVSEVGLRGKRVGDAQFSDDHGNIIFNLGEAGSDEVAQLIKIAKSRVRDEFGIELDEEVVFIG